ncbi:MAG: peptidylprolyl isomerase [Longimicrobiaceae bacterium]
MSKIRNSTVFVALVFGLGMVGWFLMDFSLDGSPLGGAAGEIGSVNGQPVTFLKYQETYQRLAQQAQQEGGLSSGQQRELEGLAWRQVVNDILLEQEMRGRGIQTSNQEVRQAAYLVPHPELMRNEIFMTDGRFDLRRYQEFLSSPTTDDRLLLELEQYYRDIIPRNKLVRQVTSGIFPTDQRLWQLWRDQNETATVDYLFLDPSRLVPGEVEVSDAEARRYYREHRDDFERSATARLTLAVIEKEGLTAADSAAALERARRVRAGILEEGGDFAETARLESADPGSREQGGTLAPFGRGTTAPEFEEAAFSLPLGEVSQPVLSDFGYHLIQVSEREDDLVTASHILIPIEKGDEELDALYARVDSLELLALDVGARAAAGAVDAALRREIEVSEGLPLVDGVGSAIEAVYWAEEVSEEETGERVSPVFETDQAFYLAELEGFSPAGVLPWREAAPIIRRLLALEKKRERTREIGREMVAEVRAGSTLEEVAARRGLEVERVEGLTRTAPNRVFGQSNAAVGAAFGTPLGEVSGVAETSAGLFLVRPLERVAADREEWAVQKEQQRAGVTTELQQEALARWLEALRESAEVVDRRDQVLEPAA